jgi:hypothetical protein
MGRQVHPIHLIISLPIINQFRARSAEFNKKTRHHLPEACLKLRDSATGKARRAFALSFNTAHHRRTFAPNDAVKWIKMVRNEPA